MFPVIKVVSYISYRNKIDVSIIITLYIIRRRRINMAGKTNRIKGLKTLNSSWS